MKRLALIGSRDFAIQIKEIAESTGEYLVVGCFDDFEEEGKIVNGMPILGKRTDIEIKYKDNVFDYIFLASGYQNFHFREVAFSELKGKVPFANIIKRNVIIGSDVKLGEGIYIGDDAKIGSRTVIEDNVFIHGDTHIAHDNIIGAHTYISGRFNTAGFTKLGKRNFYGICSVISDHVTICDDVWIGLGCIIVRNIKEPGKYMINTKLLKIE